MRRKAPVLSSFTGVAFRATTYDVPLWVDPNRRAGRWNAAGVGCTQYFCLDAEAPYAEKLRSEDLRTEEEARTYRATMWQLQVTEGAVADYSTFDLAERAGFDAQALIDDDHERCRDEAARLQARGARGVLSPSAALPGSVNLTLFGPRYPAEWNTTVQLASMIPAQRLSQGHAPAGLVDRVRFYGERHADYEDWEQSRRARARRRKPGESA